MKKNALFIALLSASYTAHVHCMDEALKPSYNPPSYSALPASAPQDERVSGMGSRVPQGNDVYMTYLEWWERDRVPVDVRNKSVRTQAEWLAEKKARLVREQEERDRKQEENKNERGCAGFSCGVLTACIVLKTLVGLP